MVMIWGELGDGDKYVQNWNSVSINKIFYKI